MGGITRRKLLVGAAATPIVVATGVAVADSMAATVVTPSNTVVGPGLPLFGLNMGHYMPGSNTTAWIRYSRINAARVFASPDHWIEDADIDSGASVRDLASFDAAKAELRRDPEATTFLDWPTILQRYESTVPGTTNKFTLNHLFGELKKLGLTVVAETDVGGSWTEVWDELWRKWQKCYAHAYYLAKNFGVVRYAIFNEPDVPRTRSRIPYMGTYLRALRIASDAIRCAVEDAGARLGTSMRALIHAPVITRSTMHDYGTTSDGPMTPTNMDRNRVTSGYWGNDPRDDEKGWGQSALESIHVDYHGETVPYKIFDVYDTHSYNEKPTWYRSEIPTIKEKIRTYAGTDLPIVYSEINRYNTSWYKKVGHTMEYPPIARDIGHTAATATHFNVGSHGGGLIFFKFSNTAGYRTGFYYVDERSEPYDIRGATKGAEVLRLFGRGLTGDVQRLSVPITNRPGSLSVYGSYDPSAHRYQFFATQDGGNEVAYDLDLSQLSPGTSVGQVVTIEEVSARRAGGIARWVEVPDTKRITCTQPGESTWLITVPDSTVRELEPLTATQNAMVRNGADADRALGGQTLAVLRGTNAQDEVTFLRFDPPKPTSGTLVRAVLQVYGRVPAGADLCTFFVFACPDLEWSEDTLTWNSAPYLPSGDSVLTKTGDKVWPAGQMTVTESFTYHRIDVTDVVQAIGDKPLTFILIKQARHADDTGENDRRVTLVNRQDDNTWARPRLRVWTSQS